VYAQLAPGAMSGAAAAAIKLDKQKAHQAAIVSCEAMWDRGTHMTKTEWSHRMQDRLRQLELN
jgi:hypothetical protein